MRVEAGQLSLPRVERKRYQPVGLCIYCGSTDELSDEHILPYGLGGNIVLPRASCTSCAKVTGRIEAKVLRGPFRPIRVLRRIQSRSSHRNAPRELPLRIQRGGAWQTVHLPHEQYPLLVNFPRFAPPGCLDPEYEGSLRVLGVVTFLFGPRPELVLQRLGGETIEVSELQFPVEFARMTAKVAYAMAVAERVIDPCLGRPEVVHSILGHSDEIGRWVGTLTHPLRRFERVDHVVAVQKDVERGLLVGWVQYFSDLGTPEYGVVLGGLGEGFVRGDK